MDENTLASSANIATSLDVTTSIQKDSSHIEEKERGQKLILVGLQNIQGVDRKLHQLCPVHLTNS